MNPFPIYRCGFRAVRSVEEWINQKANRLGKDVEIRLSDALPGRISEGEATLHPHFFDICKLLRSKFNNPLHITTNGSKLTKEFIDRMAEFLPFNVMISYHSSNPDHWTSIFGLSNKEYGIATESLGLMKQAGIGVSAAVVTLPAIVGYNDLETTFRFLNLYANSITVWEPGYSKLASDELKAKLQVDRHDFVRFIDRMYKWCEDTVLYWSGEPKAPLPINVVELMQETVKSKYKTVAWLTATGNQQRLYHLVKESEFLVPNTHRVLEVPNNTYGGNIKCNGLLMVSDIQAVLDTINVDAVIIPDVMLDRFGRDLKGVSKYTLRTQAHILWR